jgi:tetratricopeptide (TPR) repeat protein
MAIESASAQAVADAPSLSRPEISNLTIPKLEELESAFESARIRSRDGKPDEAVPDLRQLAHRASTAPSIIVQIAAVLREIGQYDEAEALLQQAAQSHPSDRGIAAAFASLAFQRGAWQEAVARFRRYVETFSEDPVGYARLSQAELQLGPLHVREAEMALEKGLLRHAGDGELLSGYARLAESRGLWDEALARWSICARRLSLDPVGYVGMCFALFRLGRLGEAETCLARALVRFPTAPDLVSVQARVAFARQNWSEALMHWSRYSELRPGDAFADLQAKICHEKLAS